MNVFKKCSMCGRQWIDTIQFALDRDLFLNGYQAAFESPEDGLLLFTHQQRGCGTTLAVKATHFKPLVVILENAPHNTGQAGCPGLCQDRTNLGACEQECDMRWVRDVIQVLKANLKPETANFV